MNCSQGAAKAGQADTEYLYFFEKCRCIAEDALPEGEVLHGKGYGFVKENPFELSVAGEVRV